MKTPQDGGPAFPTEGYDNPNHGYQPGCDGMTLRDWFAGMALQHAPQLLQASSINKSIENIATWSYEVADAMLAARKAPSGLEG